MQFFLLKITLIKNKADISTYCADVSPTVLTVSGRARAASEAAAVAQPGDDDGGGEGEAVVECNTQNIITIKINVSNISS